MKFQSFSKLSLLAIFAFCSCNSDDDSTDSGLVIPTSYTFIDEAGKSTVSFNGQTTRLKQGEEILDLFETYGTTEALLDEMYTGVPDPEDDKSIISSGFTDETLNGTSRLLRDKTADSDDYFEANTTESNAIKLVFDGYISSQVDTFLSVYTTIEDVSVATAGVAGIIGERLVNEGGLEYKQAFNKGLIGALTLDQIVNNYLTRCLVLSTQNANTEGTLDGENNYTLLEHYWDEAYGYVYGDSEDDSFLFKYIERVEEDVDFAGISNEVETAFITGRAAIVANEYGIVAEQVGILQQLLSEVIAIRAVYYLQQGKIAFSDNSTIEDGSAFHALSEGYGFIYSLRFTQNPLTNDTFFTKEVVDGYLADLEANNGFWQFEADTTVLDTISEGIAAQFNFSVAAAAELTAE